MPRHVLGARIALLDFNLQKHRLQMGVQVLVKNPAELEAIRQREADITKEKIAKILAAGANVILTTKVRRGGVRPLPSCVAVAAFPSSTRSLLHPRPFTFERPRVLVTRRCSPRCVCVCLRVCVRASRRRRCCRASTTCA